VILLGDSRRGVPGERSVLAGVVVIRSVSPSRTQAVYADLKLKLWLKLGARGLVGPATKSQNARKLAEREGFEPSVEFPLHTLSKRAPSTTRTSLRLQSTTYGNVERAKRDCALTQSASPHILMLTTIVARCGAVGPWSCSATDESSVGGTAQAPPHLGRRRSPIEYVVTGCGGVERQHVRAPDAPREEPPMD
jgi:hypothetical protein